MRKKIIGIFFCMLTLLPMLSSSPASTPNEDLNIKISAGYFGREIGRGVTVEIISNINGSITVFVNLSFDSLFIDKRDTNTSWITTFENYYWLHLGLGFRISLFSITVEIGNTTVSREGIIIYRLLILLN